MLKKFLFSLLFLIHNCFAFTFVNCTVPQQNDLIIATHSASEYSKNVIKEKDSGIFIKWMGFNEINDIKQNFKYINNVLEAEYIDFHCDCNDTSSYAVSSTNIDYKITICPRFWMAKLNGFDSRTGTLIHELSHFKDLLATYDFFISQDECLEAAKPVLKGNHKIIMENANSYEYLAEDINKN